MDRWRLTSRILKIEAPRLAVADVLDLDTNNAEHKKRITRILAVWFSNGVLATEDREDQHRKERKFVVPGPWNDGEGPDRDDVAPV
jgi:hypothetical protein